MSKKAVLLFTLMTLGFASLLFFQNFTTTPISDEGYDVIVVAGQSNAAGAGSGTYQVEKSLDNRIFQLGRFGSDNYQIVPAYDTLQNWDFHPTHKTIGFAMSFARKHIKTLPAGRKILIVPAAKGSTSILQWQPGNELYDDMLGRVNHALESHPGNKLVAVLWHQGESDVLNVYNKNPLLRSAGEFESALFKVLSQLRSDFSKEGVFPILLGEFVHTWFSIREDYLSTKLEVQNALHNVSKRIKVSSVVSSKGLKSNFEEFGPYPNGVTDKIHFSASSQVEFGTRYYANFNMFNNEFNNALKLGVVDFPVTPWLSRSYQPLIDNIHLIGPGIINEFAFMYGGVNQQYLNTIKSVATQLTAKLPKTLLGGRFPEHLNAVAYPVKKLNCGGSMGQMEFDHRLMVGRKATGNYYWVDPTKKLTQEYFLCTGKFYIDNGIRMLAFTFSKGIVQQSSDPEGTLEAFRFIQEELNNYATGLGIKIYWGGDGYLSKILPLEYTFQPIRVFTNHSWANPAWLNKIIRKDVGVGFSYVLSKAMIDSMKAETDPRSKIIFYVDNYDGIEDDLRRFMELDSQNRRYMMQESVKVAKLNGVAMSLPLIHCEGCIAKDKTVDPCHILPANPEKTGYDALACGDLPSIIWALRSKNDHEIVVSANHISDLSKESVAICSKDIRLKGDCTGNCIWGKPDQVVPLSPQINQHFKISYKLGLGGYCNISTIKPLNSIDITVSFANEWAICSPEIKNICNSSCIGHKDSNLEYRNLNNFGKKVRVIYSKDQAGNCKAEDEILLSM